MIRFLAAAAPQARDAVFAPVGQAAQRKAAAESFAHALSLSLDYHQTKRTGSLSRTIDRGARSIDYLMRILIFNMAPTVLELVLAAAVLAQAYDWRFAATAVATVAVGYLAWWACLFTYESWEIHELSKGLLVIPIWVPQASFALGSLLLWLAAVDELVIVLRGDVPTFVRLVHERHAAGDFSSDL